MLGWDREPGARRPLSSANVSGALDDSDRMYTPTGNILDQRVPMVVMLHGCTQTPAGSAAGTKWNPLADRQTFVVVYPGSRDNPMR